MPFGIDTKKLQDDENYFQAALQWVIAALTLIATKEGITLPAPPAPPQD
jgi:hypothetical protein